MPRRSHAIEIEAPATAVFDLVHDYSRRLTWDSMLSEARLLNGAVAAEVGTRSLCVGTWRSAYLPFETEYVSFQRGRVAAVKLTNRPALFGHFAATIRHDDLDRGRCRTTYVYSFRARPAWLAWFLEPIIDQLISREVRARLQRLQEWFNERRNR